MRGETILFFSVSSSVVFLHSFFFFFYLREGWGTGICIGKASSLEASCYSNVRQSRRRRRSSQPLPLDGSPESEHFFLFFSYFYW